MTSFLSSNNDYTDTQALITYILTELKPKTLDYKLIVSATLISNDTQAYNKHSLGFLWDEKNDGNYTVKQTVENGTIIVNVSYIKL